MKILSTDIIPVGKLTESFFDTIYKQPLVKRARGNQAGGRGKKKVYYVDLISSFDIETTRIHDYTKKDREKAEKEHRELPDNTVMYIWQWAFTWKDGDGYRTVCTYGRTWESFLYLVEKLTRYLDQDTFMVVYDHNLGYEFQFLRGVLPFSPESVFSVKARQPLKAVTGNLEFRCSYKLSNMSLRAFAKQMQTPHQKTELQYTTKRFWDTPLTDEELTYCVNDVICLNECIITKLEREGDTLYTIPLTSTGYVRRDVKAAVSAVPGLKQSIRAMMPDYETYVMLKEAFRGGNTHANRYYSGILLEEKDYGPIHSADRSSSYPAVICNCKYPMAAFKDVPKDELTVPFMLDYMDHDEALLMRVAMKDVQLKDITWGAPYLSISKCRCLKDEYADNGRVLSASYLETTITDVDLQIILEEYNAQILVIEAKYAKYGRLPRAIVDKVIEYYKDKTALKGVEGSEYFYMKSKNLLNSIYGMMVQDLVKVLILYIEGDECMKTGTFKNDPEAVPEEILEKTEKKAFLNYAWGVWVAGWARYELEQGIKAAGEGFIYCDTDSVKYIGDVDWTEYNARKVAESMESGSHATDPKGKEHYMGVFEPEHDMSAFITYGAKKYAFLDKASGELTITVAGVGKSAGVKELAEEAKKDGVRGIDEFKEGFTFKTEAGGLEAVYNDMPLYGTATDDGHMVRSNVTLRPSTYTLGLTADYARLISGCDFREMDDLL